MPEATLTARRNLIPGDSPFHRPVIRAGAFTLIELLVIIAVVTVLVAIVVPVTIQIRNRARAVACLSNLRQLGGATLAYSQAWDDRLPELAGTPFAGGNPTSEWPEGSSATQMRELLSRYAKSAGVFRCLNDLGAPEYGYPASGGPVCSRSGSSYLPWSTARTGQHGVAVNGARTTLLAHSTTCIILRDYGANWHGFRSRSGLCVEACNVANAVFSDSHTATVPVLTIAASARDYACWVSNVRGTAGLVFIAGGSGGVQAELSGRRTVVAGEGSREQVRIGLSGTVSAGGTVHSVDRVFLFAADTTTEAAFRHIVNWIESLAAG